MPEPSFRSITHRKARTAPRAPRERRLPRFLDLDPVIDAGKRLGRLRIGVIGAGAVGRHFVNAIARLEPAELWIVDHGKYKPESLNTQPIGPSEVGRKKASSTGRVVKAIHPTIDVRVFDGPVEALGDDAFRGLDAIFLATDNLHAELDGSRRAAKHGAPLIHGAVYGDALVAQVRLLLNRDGAGPCIACGWGEAERQHLANETEFSCEGVEDGHATVNTMPTMSVAGLSSIAADLGLMILFRLVLGLGTPLTDSLLEYCGYNNQITTSPLIRNPDCPEEHAAWQPSTCDGPLYERTPRQLAVAAGLDLSEANGAVSFMVDRYSFAEFVSCECGEPRPFGRFVMPGRSWGRCRRCGQQRTAAPSALQRKVPLSVMNPLLDRPLRSLGATRVRYAVVRDSVRTFFLIPDEQKGDGA